MAKPSYKELEKKVRELEQKVNHTTHLEGQLKDLEHRFLQVEKQLRQRQRMDSMGTLAQGVAHDFNNILSGIMAYLNILSLTSDNFSHPQKTYVKNIINSVKRGAAVIKQFQTLSSQTVSAKKTIDIYSVAKEVFQLLNETTDKMIEKVLDIEKGRFFIFADMNEIHQIFMNLGTNAVHAIEEKGVEKGDHIRMTVNPSCVKGSDLKRPLPGEFYHICFEDTGSGMPDSVSSKVFDPLFTTKQNVGNKGQGMGLAMVHDIVCKRHNGHIEVVSSMGKGSIFNIFLPKSDETSGPAESQFKIQGGTETILVVDDDLGIRESIEMALEGFGYKVILGCDGKEGLTLFKENYDKIDVVVLDMIMPIMSGKELLRDMLKIDPQVKVIIASGHTEEKYNDTIIKSAKNYLNKPFELNELENAIRQVIDL